MAKHEASSTRTDLQYGQWCTIDGHRYMITNWTNESVEVLHEGSFYTYENEFVSDVSDFMETDAERKAKGYAF